MARDPRDPSGPGRVKSQRYSPAELALLERACGATDLSVYIREAALRWARMEVGMPRPQRTYCTADDPCGQCDDCTAEDEEPPWFREPIPPG